MRTLWIMAVLLVGVEGSVVQLTKMIVQEMGKNALTSYSLYGCNCGPGGRRKPMDATDRCCFVHDCCYGKVNGCNPKKAVYIYSLENGDIVCGGDDPCRKEVCECDKAAAICFRDNMDTYDNKHWNVPSENCQEESERC
uniref:Phospholipase A2 n=1 Tax=Trimeresurus popeiorum TaxID=109786 RepID=A0A0H3U1X1_9SAUR|nr:phospholipase A2 [Trimeresurus popeiorum]